MKIYLVTNKLNGKNHKSNSLDAALKVFERMGVEFYNLQIEIIID